MAKIKCVAVDDDLFMLAIIEDLVKQFPDLELVGSFHNSVEATTGITKQKPDLIFLDILMPGLNGLDVLDVMDIRPYVIVISGKKEIKESVLEHPQVVDFLEKPVETEVFQAAVDKCKQIIAG
jgi:response regulator of citrate/malate metabolism